jgi:uncharacterized protein YndB with AHSA1/START domain
MTRTLAALAAVASLIAGPALAQTSRTPHVTDTSFVSANGARTIQESAVIDAPVAILWKAFTDTEEFKRWNSPVAAIDLRVGGSLEASYDTKHALGDPDNIKHRIITFLPERLVVFQNIQAPKQLPDAARFQQTVTVLQYEPMSATRTRVTISSTGWAADAGSDRLYGFFRNGNASLLEKMKSVYEAPSPR